MVSKMTKSGQDSNKEWSGLLQNWQEKVVRKMTKMVRIVTKNGQENDKKWSGQ